MRCPTVFIYYLVLILYTSVFSQNAQDIESISSAEYLEKARDYYASKDYKDAIETLNTLVESADPDVERNNIYKGYELLGNIYLSLKDYEKSSETFLRAEELAEISKNDTLIASALGNLGRVYLLLPEGEEKGIEYYERSIKLNKEIGREKENLSGLLNLSRSFLRDARLELAYPILIEAKQAAADDSLNYSGTIQAYTLLGTYHALREQATLAEEFLVEAAEIASNHNLINEEEEVQMALAEFYAQQSDFEAAYYHSQRQLELSNTLYKNEKEREIQIASAKFGLKEYQRELEIAKNEQEFKDQLFSSSKKTASIFLIASVILLIALLVIFQMYGSRKKYIKRLRRNNKQLVLAKEEAEKLSKLKTQFFSTVSHELRTPLYGVIGIASILLEDKKITAHRDDLKSLKFSADYLLALINDVLLMSKMEAKHISLEYSPFRLSTLLKSITRSFEFSLEQNNNKLHLEIDSSLPDSLVGDSVRLSQILMNLIGNAIKFNENGNIWVFIENKRITSDGKYEIAFTIKDDGIGIPLESQQSIFEEFSQLQHENYNYQGTGLGLSIVRKLLALHDSDITLKSAEGQGATFSFVITLEEAKEVSVSSEESSVSLEVDSGIFQNANILIVDDNKINQKITQKILKQREYVCSIANNGEEAIMMAKNNKYDLILMDIHMPRKDGIQATLEIREFDQETPIVALTAVEIAEIRHKIQNAGMDDILVKPYDISRFLNVILRNLGRKRNQSFKSSGS